MMQYLDPGRESQGERPQEVDPLVGQRLRVVGSAAGATVLAFQKQTGIDVPGELAQAQPQYPTAEATPMVEAPVTPPLPEGPDNFSLAA